jgi:hypothetical protein
MQVADKIRLALASWLVVAAGLGCATARGRESSEPAELVTTSAQSESGYSTKIVGLDGKEVSRSSFSMDPGRHTVEVEGECAGRNSRVIVGAVLFGVVGAVIAHATEDTNGAGQRTQYSGRLRACFIARPGRTYEVRTYAEGSVWKVEVVDQTTTYDVKSPCKPEPSPEFPLTGGPQRPPDPFDK